MEPKQRSPQRKRSKRRPDSSIELARELASSLSSEGALSLLRDIESSNWQGIVQRAMPNPSDYSEAHVFREDYMAYSLLRKFPHFPLSIDRVSEALRGFHEAELACSRTNDVFPYSVTPPGFGQWSVGQVLFLAQRKINSLLGSFDWNLVADSFSFTSGASYDLPRKKGDPYYKFGSNQPTVTPPCLALAITCVKQVPRWAEYLQEIHGTNPRDWFKLVPGNRVTTVPKDAKTDRTIAIEPTMNMYIQKGIGDYIRRRLKRVGIDLNDQTPNQIAAKEGSLSGLLATIDLSSASDSVALGLVEWILPPDWFLAIDATRSHYGVLPDGTLTKYQKVSSMGNGFTFELESLIFWALARSVTDLVEPESRVLVYGDDIVIPSICYAPLVEVLTYCGFTVNMLKSFSSGPFRESCGKHYFLGHDVTPFYVRDRINNDLRYIWFANQVKRWASHWTGGPCDRRLIGVYRKAVKQIADHKLRRPRIPDGLGDGALVGSAHECKSGWRWSRERACYLAQILCEVKCEKRCSEEIPALLRYFQSTRVKPSDREQFLSTGALRVRRVLLRFWRWTSLDPYWV